MAAGRRCGKNVRHAIFLPRNCIILWKTLLLHNLTDSDIMVKILWVDDEIELLKPHVLFLRQKGGMKSTPATTGTTRSTWPPKAATT